ncbi:MAG: aromatic amino acid ammonia-lyase [Candidatus Marinimicrobia bacterium]|nr:aromatic amino acid ammonia-lyase [Candidatus Neomarinimicrobiota bacterium]|tara:strand:- start:211 stop:477 length:267 start_codon:yes stop_codon:yes gene_type:complete
MSAVSISSKIYTDKEFPTSFKGQVTVWIERNAQEAVKSSHKRLADILARGDKIYEINTGFGKLIQITTGESDQKELQLNLFTKRCSKS